MKFDSKWEFNIYQQLIKAVGVDNVQLQPSIELKPKTTQSGAVTYVCDFLVYNFWYIEAKGFLTPEASCKLKMLEVVHPTIASRLFIVSERVVHLFGKKHLPTTTIFAVLKVLDNFQKYRASNQIEGTTNGKH